jgi:membrane protease YdiL (CAAX protease family)
MPSPGPAGSENRLSAALLGLGPAGVLAIVAVLLAGNVIGALLVAVWVGFTRTPWARLGLIYPTNLKRTLLAGVVIGIGLKLLMKALVMPALGFPAVNATYQYLTGNRPAVIRMVITVVFAAGFGEELIWRGFLFARLRPVLRPMAVLAVSSLLFALAHVADQGLAGAAQAFLTGAAFGGLFLGSGDLWLPIVAHAAFDITAVLLIFWNFEASVAHTIFR